MASLLMVVTYLLSHLFLALGWTFGMIADHSTEVVWAAACGTLFYVGLRYIFQLHITVHPSTKRVFREMVLMFQEESMFTEETIPATPVTVGDTDADLTRPTIPGQSDSTQAPQEKGVKSHRRVHYAVRVAHMAKAELGLMSNTKASELVYARVCREAMIKHGVRKSHIAHLVPLAVAACFIPLDEDFLAASIRQSREMQERRALLGPLYWK